MSMAQKTFHIPQRCQLPLLFSAMLFQGTLHAQSPLSVNDPVDLDSVSVTGVRASIQKSLLDKRNAVGMVDAIAAEDFGKFPDLNLSESLQRISGITLDRGVTGEGSAINLRGLGPEFTRVEINGMSGLSNTTGRQFNFEMFASELFSKATVHKTGQAAVDEGGLAGTVRLETPRPLDSQGTRIVGTALGNYSEMTGDTNPRAALLFNHNHNDTFGIAASIAWSQTDFVSNAVQAISWRPFSGYNNPTDARPDRIRASDEERAALIPLGPVYTLNNEVRETTGATLTLQFRPSETVSFTFDGLYGKLDSERMAVRYDMPLEGGANAPTNAVIENGVMTAGDFTVVQQRVGASFINTKEDYRQLMLAMEWTPDEWWTIRPTLGQAKRVVDRSNNPFFSFRVADRFAVNPFDPFDPGTVSYRLRGDFIDFSSTATDYSSNPEDFLFNVFIMQPNRNQAKETQARIDVDRAFAGSDHTLKFGLRYNEHTLDRIARQTRLNRDASTTPPNTLPGLDSAYRHVDFKVRGAGPDTPSRMLTVDASRMLDIFMPSGVPIPGIVFTDLTGFGAQQTYSIQEKTASGWMQMDLTWNKWTLLPGVRYVRTEQVSNGFNVFNANQPTQEIIPVRVANTYHGLLPALSARVDVRADIVLRAAYARTLTRPNLASLAPSESIEGTGTGGRGTRGNPNLSPYYAHNLDLGAEWYFSSEGVLAANVFYKKISDFIDTRTFEEERIYPRMADGVLITGMVTFTEPVNGVSADIKGIELLAQSRFSRFPGIWSNLGGSLNYSHTESSADFATIGDVRSQGLPGLSKNSVNAALYYDDGRFDARLAYAWRDRYLAQFSDVAGIPRFTKSYGQLDLSFNYHINPRLSLQLQALNLTREQRIDQSTTRYLPYGVTELDRRFMLGLRAVF